jgi:hypothetical protein
MGTTLVISSGISLVLIGVGILFGVGAFQAWRSWSNLLQHQVMIEGCITDLDRRETTDGDSNTINSFVYYVNYNYDYEGQNYACEVRISKKHYRAWKRGTSITVRIPSNDPGNASLLAEASLLGDTSVIWGFALAGLLCFGSAIMVFWLV